MKRAYCQGTITIRDERTRDGRDHTIIAQKLDAEVQALRSSVRSFRESERIITLIIASDHPSDKKILMLLTHLAEHASYVPR